MRSRGLAPSLAAAVIVLATFMGPPARAQTPSQAKTATRSGADRNPRYTLVQAPAKQVQAELTVRIDAPRFSAQEWVVYAAELPLLSYQTGVRSTLEPGGVPGRESSLEHRGILRVRLPATTPELTSALEIRVEYQATLWSRRLVPVRANEPNDIPPPPPLDAAERRAALAAGGQFDFTSAPFQHWLEEHRLRRNPEEADIDFARRAFLAIKESFRYVSPAGIERQASKLCRASQSDCGGMSVVFVSALRACGIPARVLVGRWAQSSSTEADGRVFDQQHVKAEFYAQGVGWVPADVTSGVLHDRSPEGLTFFGSDPGDFLVLHVGTNLICDTAILGRKTIPWLQSPAHWAVGPGTFNQSTTLETWLVKTTPPPDLVEATLKQPTTPTSRPKRGRPPAPRPRP